VTPRGLTTGPVHDRGRLLSMSIDVCDMVLVAEAEGGARTTTPLGSGTVAGFLAAARAAVEAVGGSMDIHGRPNENADAIPFAEDEEIRPWNADAV